MRFLIVSLFAVSACHADNQKPLTDATSLLCPYPGDLPFRLDSSGFQQSTNAGLVVDDTRSKDESSDTIGNPGGIVGSIYLADSATPTDTTVDYHGAKARTTPDGGLRESFLPGEHVSLWSYDPAAQVWQTLGGGDTDTSGYYDLPATGIVEPNGQPVYSMLEADGSCAEHYTYLFPPGEKVVVVDIDGTLTLSDNELLMEIPDDTYVPVKMGAADRLTQAWSTKGYPIIYLTARPHLFRNETRVWLRDLGFPGGPLLTAISLEDAAPYKTTWLDRMVVTFGWNIVAAYGNADTDITAYNAAGIPKSQTFIVGPLAGNSGTMPIANMDYSDHITTYVNAQPDNN